MDRYKKIEFEGIIKWPSQAEAKGHFYVELDRLNYGYCGVGAGSGVGGSSQSLGGYQT